MKNKIFYFIFVFVFNFVAYSKINENIKINTEVNMGAKFSKINEIVVQNDRTVSDIIWFYPIAPIIENKLNISLYNIGCSICYGSVFSTKIGIVEDKDYLFEDKSLLSNYSYHNNFIDKDYFLDAKLYYDFYILNNQIKISPIVNIFYENKKFTAKDGFYQYSLVENVSVSDKTLKTYLQGSVMSYEVSSFFCGFGVNFLYINSIHAFGVIFRFSPFVFTDSIDTHYLRAIEFYDSMKGYMFSFDFKYELILKKKLFKLLAEINSNYSKTEGISASRNIGEKSELVKSDNILGLYKDVSIKFLIGIKYLF